jgi:serine/threonine-protein kinase
VAPGWREVLRTFMAAGRGLAAAHAAGIVHRDIKPENMIVGADRVVVVDFGLARADRDTEADGTDPARLLEVSVTLTGERVGTPLYMSPEQRAGGDVTASSDLYSFCVALWEAFHGAPPSDEADAPRRAEVPDWVNRAVTRGLARDPAQRWPSMDSLLAALARDPARRRRRVAVTVGVVAMVAGGAAIAGAFGEQVDPCGGARARLAGIWDDARKLDVQRAFLATRISYAGDTWRHTSARLDAYAAGWVGMYTETCRASRVEGRQSDTMMDLRMRCLEQRRARLGALAELWSRGMDAASIEHAIGAVDNLPLLPECADARTLAERAPLPTDPALVARIAGVRARVDAAQALRLGFRLSAALAGAAAARADADAIGWPQLQAEAASAEADVLADQRQPRDAQWLAAARLAFAARDDRLAAHALVGLTYYLANDANKTDRALTVAEVAEGVVTRSGGDDRLRIDLQRYRGDALRLQGKFDAARAAYTASHDDAVKTLGPHGPQALTAGMRLTDIALAMGHYAEARRRGEDNLSAMIAALGADHPTVGSQLNTLGNVASNAGDLPGAVEYYRRALAVFERQLDPDTLVAAFIKKNLASVEINLGHLAEAEKLVEQARGTLSRTVGVDQVEIAKVLEVSAMLRRKQGRFDEARAAAERSLQIRTRVQGPMHPDTAYPLEELGFEGTAQGEPARGLIAHQQALAIRKKALGADHGLTLASTTRVATALALLGRCPEALPLIATAVDGLEKLGDAASAYLAETLTVRGDCELAQGRAQQAAMTLVRALELEEKIGVSPFDRGVTRWPLARALWARREPRAALAAAKTAEIELGNDADGARDRVAVHAWLAAHQHP